jgi:peptide/nickel transport system substrate-binding protein
MGKTSRRAAIAGVLAAAIACSLAAVGSTATRVVHREGGTATMVTGAFQSLDPQVAFFQTNSELEYVVYTPLLTYAHASGLAGTKLIPGLATSLPKISRDLKTYTLTLRKGLKYSNGQSAKASDFAHVLERALKLNWGGSSFLTAAIVGAKEFQAGQASSISGVKTNDRTGLITIRLIAGDGAFSDVLAFTGLGLVPSSTPMTDQGANPPPGIGAYKITNVVPGRGLELVKNAVFPKLKLPGIPSGHLANIKVTVNSNALTAADSVLNNEADILDPTGAIPPALLDPISQQAADRFRAVPTPRVQYIFFNTTIPPFNNKNARVAATLAFDRKAAVRLEAGFLQTGCYILPPQFPGRSTQACPYGKPRADPNVSKAKAMIQQANLDGTSVTVYAPASDPFQQIASYYVSVLNSIGFKASLNLLAASIYYPTTANPTLKIQTGIASYGADYSNPSTFYHLLDARTITPTFSVNRDQLNDARVQSVITKLQPLRLTPAVTKQWAALDYYSAQQAFWLVLGYQRAPYLFSNRIDVKKAILQQRYLIDLSSLQLK